MSLLDDMKDLVISILKRAVNAPSGHNFQPWRFRVHEGTIEVHLIPNADQTILNFEQRGSYVAIGALIENILVLADALGYKVELTMFPSTDSFFVARIKLLHNTPSNGMQSLAECIDTRSTQRVAYATDALIPTDIAALSSSTVYAKTIFVTDRAHMARIAEALSIADWLIFNCQTMHTFVFDHIVWSEAEQNVKRSGLYIATLDLEPPVRALFNVFKFWSIASILGRLGFGTIVARQNSAKYLSSAAFIGVVVPNSSSKDFVEAGRHLQSVWLRATAIGYSMQPLMGTLYLYQRLITEGSLPSFSSHAEAKVRCAGEVLESTFNPSGKLVAIARIGKSLSLVKTSSKREPHIEFF